MKRRLLVAGASVAASCIVLSWPAATWLQCRSLHVSSAQEVDAVYLVAGAKGQRRRVEALLDFAAGGRDWVVLIANDTVIGRWSRAQQRNLTMAQWAEAILRRELPARDRERGTETIEPIIVPGMFSGTDREMELLSVFLRTRPEIHAVALVTCSFHARRAVARLRRHAGGGLEVSVVPVPQAAVDRLPWVVLGELAKLARDALGWSRVQWLSRGE